MPGKLCTSLLAFGALRVLLGSITLSSRPLSLTTDRLHAFVSISTTARDVTGSCLYRAACRIPPEETGGLRVNSTYKQEISSGEPNQWLHCHNS